MLRSDQRCAADLDCIDKAIIRMMAECDMYYGRVARRLNYSPNTILYRCKQIRSVTGYNPREFYGLLELLKELGEPALGCMPIKQERHGRWMRHNVGIDAYDCSVCGTLGSPRWKRCPLCEAKMDLEGEG